MARCVGFVDVEYTRSGVNTQSLHLVNIHSILNIIDLITHKQSLLKIFDVLAANNELVDCLFFDQSQELRTDYFLHGVSFPISARRSLHSKAPLVKPDAVIFLVCNADRLATGNTYDRAFFWNILCRCQ